MPVPICPRNDSEQGHILRGIKCPTAPSSHVRKNKFPSWDFNNFAVTVFSSLTVASTSWTVCEMKGKRSYSSCFLGCCFKDLLKTTRSIFAQFSSSFFFFELLVINPRVQMYNSTDTAAAEKNPWSILEE